MSTTGETGDSRNKAPRCIQTRSAKPYLPHYTSQGGRHSLVATGNTAAAIAAAVAAGMIVSGGIAAGYIGAASRTASAQPASEYTIVSGVTATPLTRICPALPILNPFGTPTSACSTDPLTPLPVLGWLPPITPSTRGSHPSGANNSSASAGSADHNGSTAAATRLGGNGATLRVVGPNIRPNIHAPTPNRLGNAADGRGRPAVATPGSREPAEM